MDKKVKEVPNGSSEKNELKNGTDEKETFLNLNDAWVCSSPKCGFKNGPSHWQCFACFDIRKIKKTEKIRIPETMTALVKEEKMESGYKLVRDYKVPEPGEGEVLVKTYASGVCGSDMMLYKWSDGAERVAKRPFTPGHETAGLVVKVGPKIHKKGLRVGSRVCVENHLYCNDCFQCKQNRRDICANMGQFGHGKGTNQGGLAEYFTISAKYCYRLTVGSKISWRDAALMEPLGVGINAISQMHINNTTIKNETILIIGSGTIGLMICNVLKLKGYRNIIACDIWDNKLEIAKKMGAKYVCNSKKENLKEFIMKTTENIGVGRIIECSGHVPTINLAFQLLRKGGAMVLVGLPKTDLTIENPMQNVVFKGLTLRTIHGRRLFRSWKDGEDLMKRVKTDLLVSHDMVPLDSFESVFKEFEEGAKNGKCLKIVFDPTKTSKPKLNSTTK